MKRLITIFLVSILFLSSCGKKEEKKEIINEEIKEEEKIENTEETKEEKKINIINIDSNTRPYLVVVNNFPSAVKVQSGLSSAYMIYEVPVEGGMSRSLALYKDKYPERIGTVRSARHNFLDYVMENDAIFVHFGWSHYAQDEMNYTWSIDNINGLYDSPFWRDNPEGLAYEHTAYTNLNSVRDLAINRGYRLTTDTKPLLNYSIDEINLSDGVVANEVIVPYSSYYIVKFLYDVNTKMYKRYVNDAPHTDYYTGEHFEAKNIIVVKIDYNVTDDNYYLNFHNTGTGNGYYITNGMAKAITWEKQSRDSRTIYRYLDGTEINVNDGNTYIMMQSNYQDTTID